MLCVFISYTYVTSSHICHVIVNICHMLCFVVCVHMCMRVYVLICIYICHQKQSRTTKPRPAASLGNDAGAQVGGHRRREARYLNPTVQTLNRKLNAAMHDMHMHKCTVHCVERAGAVCTDHMHHPKPKAPNPKPTTLSSHTGHPTPLCTRMQARLRRAE